MQGATASIRVFAVEGDGKYREDWLWLAARDRSSIPSSTRPTGRSTPTCAKPARCSPPQLDYQHSYPHSWRSKAKVIYRCTPQWFVAMDKPLGLHHLKTRAEKRWENEGGALLDARTMSRR